VHDPLAEATAISTAVRTGGRIAGVTARVHRTCVGVERSGSCCTGAVGSRGRGGDCGGAGGSPGRRVAGGLMVSSRTGNRAEQER
jgi:hypothetical protein